MNTNSIKGFAREVRLMLLDGVEQRLKYWGFKEDGSNDQSLEETAGGFVFRGQVYSDPSVPVKWNKLKNRLVDKQAVLDVIEEASYTWFNRLMAIKILEVNDYIPSQIEFDEGQSTPRIVQNAKRGKHSLTEQEDVTRLNEYLSDDKDEEAFGLLIGDLCNRNRLLHDVFGRIDDYTELLLPQNLLQTDGLLDWINSDEIEKEDYKEVELIGWLYQFYIADKKDEVFAGFKKNKKARAQDIPAATQIFTPKWIVKYMVENTVGKIYLDYEPTSSLKPDMKYLVESESDGQSQSIISDVKELTLLDPACGSGHILVTGFELLFKMYKEEGYTSKQAVESILEYNLFGLDIDDRAMQLARFAVLLKAAEYDKDIFEKGIMPHIYSFPEEEHFDSTEIQSFLGNNGRDYLEQFTEALLLLNQGKNLGSIMKFDLSEESISFIQSKNLEWSKKENDGDLDLLQQDIWNRIVPFTDIIVVLNKEYAAVVANPPYLGKNGMNENLKEYAQVHYPTVKSDLYSVFMEMCLNGIINKGLLGMINQHAWMFLSTYEQFRRDIIKDFSVQSLVQLGANTFEELKGEVVQSVVFVFSNNKRNKNGIYFRLVDYSNNLEKEKFFLRRSNCFQGLPIKKFLKIPKARFGYWISDKMLDVLANSKSLETIAYSDGKNVTGNNTIYLKFIWEVNKKKIGQGLKWMLLTKGGEFRKYYGNILNIIDWSVEARDHYKCSKTGRVIAEYLWHLPGITWSKISSKSKGGSFRLLRTDSTFDEVNITFREEKFIPLVLSFLNSRVPSEIFKIYNPTLSLQTENVLELPLSDKVISNSNLELSNEQIEILKKDWNNKELSWDFAQSPLLNSKLSLKDSYFEWQNNVTQDFFQLHYNEEKINRIFIDIYGLQNELSEKVDLNDITILQKELDRKILNDLESVYREKGIDEIELPIYRDEVLSQFISYCVGIFMGRYRLDKPGLNIAHPNASEEELSAYKFKGNQIEIDEDGILPIMGNDCAFPDDAYLRVNELIHHIWGEDSLIENINFIKECFGMDLDKWLNAKFWGYHTRIYNKKPIYWLFTSNPKNPQNAAFKVLVYMHRMDKYTVQHIQRDYLHAHQDYIKKEIEKLKKHEEQLNKQELKKLELLEGTWEPECRNYNEVLKDIANQQIEFDLDDGVSVNYEKFKGAVALIK